MRHAIILCEYSGVVAKAMRSSGKDLFAMSCDILPGELPVFHIQGDALTALKAFQKESPWALAGLHWPCTWFTNAGVKWMYIGGHSRNRFDPERRAAMEKSADGLCEILNWLLEHGIPFYFENPVMHSYAMEAIIRRCEWFSVADFCSVQPWNFGTWETKRTCLWLHKLPPLVPTYKTTEECRIALGLPEFVEKDGVMVKNKPEAKCHKASPGPNRGHERSRTLPTLAAAMAAQWGGPAE